MLKLTVKGYFSEKPEFFASSLLFLRLVQFHLLRIRTFSSPKGAGRVKVKLELGNHIKFQSGILQGVRSKLEH